MQAVVADEIMRAVSTLFCSNPLGLLLFYNLSVPEPQRRGCNLNFSLKMSTNYIVTYNIRIFWYVAAVYSIPPLLNVQSDDNMTQMIALKNFQCLYFVF